MGKTWILDTETKGTGANMVPLEKAQKGPDDPPRRARRRAKSTPSRRPAEAARTTPAPRKPAEATATALPPGHVRKKATGEIGKVESVDARSGQAVVRWLKRGDVSTVPLSAISRR
jgi:hypothetical protein